MSEIKHTTLNNELLYRIGRASTPLSSAELYERCELADDITKIAKAINNLQSDGKIVRVEGEGRARYKIAPGMVAPAPAGKAGRSKAVQADDAAHGTPLSGVQPAPEPALPKIDIPPLGAPDHVADAAPKEPQTEREKGRVEAAFWRAKKSTARELATNDARLADAIIARLKRQLAPTLCELEAAAGMDRLNVHIHIEQVDFHLGGL